MLMPGYRAPEPALEAWDWQAQKELMNSVGKPPDPTKVREELAARRSTQDRFQMARDAKARKATTEEIRLILEA